jgi:hypothetical protein
MDCDLYLKRAKTGQSLIEAEMVARVDGNAGKELLATARKKEEALYTMFRIMQDVSTGRSLKDTIKAFLLA